MTYLGNTLLDGAQMLNNDSVTTEVKIMNKSWEKMCQFINMNKGEISISPALFMTRSFSSLQRLTELTAIVTNKVTAWDQGCIMIH